MILLVNGPNLNLLGEREPQIYGLTTLSEIERTVTDTCASYAVEVRAIQSNYEGAIIDFLQAYRNDARGVIINPGAFTHTSYVLHDCLKSITCPVVEVHVSNIQSREEWRKQDVVSPATTGQIIGLGPLGYYLAALWLCQQIYAANQAESTSVHPDELTALDTTEEIPISGRQRDYQG